MAMFDELGVLAKEHYNKKEYQQSLSLFEQMVELDNNKLMNTYLYQYSWSMYHSQIKKDNAFSEDEKELTGRFVKFIINKFNNKDLIYQLTAQRVIKNFLGK